MWTTLIAVSLGLGAGFAGGYRYRTVTQQQVAVTVQATPTVDPACDEARRLVQQQSLGTRQPYPTPQGRRLSLTEPKPQE